MVQYGSKFVSWVLELESVSPAVVKKIRDLESSISTARKRESDVSMFPMINDYLQVNVIIVCCLSL